MEKVILISDYENSIIEFLNYDKIIKKYDDKRKHYEDNAISETEFIEDYLISKNFSFSNINWIIIKIEDIFIKSSVFLNDKEKLTLLSNIN